MTIMDHHHCAMDLADQADRAKRLGNFDNAKQYLLKAFEHEREAAMKFERTNIEPSRSVFFRSAASLALEAGELREAEKMIAFGLSGTPPEEIAEEMRDILESIHFERHLKIRGISLSNDEMQMSIFGPAVAPGFAKSREIRERLAKMETLAYRTAERQNHVPFRRAGAPKKEITDAFEVYGSLSRVASFAITIRFGYPQKSIPGFNDIGSNVATEIFECVELIQNQENEKLKERIGNEDYYDNFVQVVKNIYPDGDSISGVGLTIIKNGAERKIKLDKKRDDIETDTCDSVKVNQILKPTIVKGYLKFADAKDSQNKFGIIKIIDVEKKQHKVRVRNSIMADVVRPFFDCKVIVKGMIDEKGTIVLKDIDRIDD